MANAPGEESDLPPVGWSEVGEWLDRNPRRDARYRAARWALDTLHEQLGDDWLERAVTSSDVGFPLNLHLLGTHTHIPTADERILPNGTAYQTDVGMSGPYDSVIGVEKELVLARFLTGMPAKFVAPGWTVRARAMALFLIASGMCRSMRP